MACRKASSTVLAAGQIGKHHAIATAEAIDQNAVSRRVLALQRHVRPER
jgi:hypothetical protein